MSDLPPENLGASRPPFAGENAGLRSRSLSEILEELALVSDAPDGDASAMRGAVSELTRALARLFETIRVDRADQRGRIAELELELQVASARVAELEEGATDRAGSSDFDALRDAAERLRRRTEELFQNAETPAQQAAREAALVEQTMKVAGEPNSGEGESGPQPVDSNHTELPVRPVHDEPLGPPGVLRVFPGVVLPQDLEDLDIESELIFDEDGPRRVAMALAVPDTPPSDGDDPGNGLKMPALRVKAPPEPIPVHPRPARKRRGLRRRRIDARRLRGVDPGTALRAMVAEVEQLWTAGHTLDLVIAMTDGGSVKVTGGDRVPLRVDSVHSGTAARSTVTAASDQIVPLFGRLELGAEQSTPLIHGSRRDADLLVGWIDRAQRLAAEPL